MLKIRTLEGYELYVEPHQIKEVEEGKIHLSMVNEELIVNVDTKERDRIERQCLKK